MTCNDGGPNAKTLCGCLSAPTCRRADRAHVLLPPRSLRRDPVHDNPPAELAEAVLEALRPEGPIEETLADCVVQATWRLRRRLSAGEADGAETRDVEAVRAALDALALLREARRPRWGVAAPAPASAIEEGQAEPDFGADAVPDFVGFPWEEIDRDEPADPPSQEGVDPSHLWRDRLVFDSDVSDTSPVVRGTWITVGHVVSLVVDGWTWADILRAHPELTEDDLRACLSYSVEEEGSRLDY